MDKPLTLTKSAWALLTMFLLMAVSSLVFEPAYYGYLVAFGIFAILRLQVLFQGSSTVRTISAAAPFSWFLFALAVVTGTIFSSPDLWDAFRDTGAIFSFLVGLVLIPRALGSNWERSLIAALSGLSMFIAAWTLIGAGRAYLAGAGAYEWRGAYVPFVHSWLPYLIVAEYIRSRMPQSTPEISMMRIGICVVALLISLSRTGLVQIAIFLLAVVTINARSWLQSGRGILVAILATGVAIAALPYLIGLDVVQERLNVGIGDDDISMGWRKMEIQAAQDYLNDGGWFRWLFGYGLGARVPLPWGTVDFNGNVSIPHLHNSYWTLIVKFGGFGTLWILAAIGMTIVRAHIARANAPVLRTGGTWLIAMVMIAAFTLQSMTEWSHLVFLGLGCALLIKAGDRHAGPA